MADDSPAPSDALPDAPPVEPSPPSEQPDIMNDPEFEPRPPLRQDTLSSKADSEGGSERVDTCRICRSESTADEPLFYPCKCSGSIKFVHQECLIEWLSHSHKKHCELCKTPFRFTKLYDANMPQTLPWTVFFKRACLHIVQTLVRACRTLLVGFVWLALIPWLIRWVWRWFFWVADAAWARDAFIEMMRNSAKEQPTYDNSMDWFANAFQQFFDSSNDTTRPAAYRFASNLVKSFGFATDNSTSSAANFAWPQADPSILSSWTYTPPLTSNRFVNRLLLDIAEGQLITCIVIAGFILVFLIREWVVQQQPLVNLENIGNVQQQIRDAAERVEAENERLRRQRQLLELARARLVEVQNGTEGSTIVDGRPIELEYYGWEALDASIDYATEQLRKGDAEGHRLFKRGAQNVTMQIRAAGHSGVELDGFTDKVFNKLASFSDEERKEWEVVLLAEIERSALARKPKDEANLELGNTTEDTTVPEEGSSTSLGRPPMPERDFSSRATQIQRLLEEADGLERDLPANDDDSPSSLAVEPHAETDRDSTQSTESWQVVNPTQDSTNEGQDSRDEQDRPFATHEPIPITNAGPDAKINIKIRGKGKLRAVPEPKIGEKMLADDELKQKLEKEVAKEMATETGDAASSSPNVNTQSQEDQRATATENNPFHPDGPEPERRNSESFGNRVASVFREEFGIDEAEELESMRQAGIGPDGETAPNDGNIEQTQPPGPADPPRTALQKLADFFWGDIQVQAPEPVPAPNEEIQQPNADDQAQEAPFVPIQNGQPDIVNAEAEPPAGPEQPQHDPEVVAAAQLAGLDAEAIEDAEDLEGIFELIGLQGPLIGLFQTSAFCTLLVACTIMGAVILPYFGGKLVLNIVGSPVYFFVKMPLQVASFFADLVIDVSLLLGGWLIMILALAIDFLLSAGQVWIPWLRGDKLVQKVVDYAMTVASNSGSRLSGLFAVSEPVEGLDWSWAFLGSSVHAHASLRAIQEEVNAVLHYMGAGVTWIVETISSGSVSAVCWRSLDALKHIPELPAKLLAGVHVLREYTQPIIGFFAGLSKGALTITNPEIPIDPSLVYWNSSDRALAILAGYLALAGLAAIYVAMDTPITRSEAGRRAEKMIRDTLRQAGGVLKVILIISIEMLVFPLYCGLLLDVAFLPLFQDATMASRWAFAGRKPYTFCFVHWFVGTCYMFHFALFVGMCRKILRKGVLWFIRDPDDPTFHPVRDVLERNVGTQLRKIAFSALVYGALVILCLGGVIWTIGRVFGGIFPIHWVSTEPVLEFPMDLLLYNFVTPLVIRLFKPSDAVNAMYGWWLRRCAKMLRLSHFLFDDRRTSEEGHLVRKTWLSFLLMKQPDCMETFDSSKASDTPETYFQRDGKYVLTPCNDQYRPPKPGEAFLHADEDDVYITDKEGKKNEHFAKVYVPPWFRLRITAFMVCLWMFSALTGLCSTLVPLVFGRYIFASLMPAGLRVNDIYAYSVGAYILGGAMAMALKGRSGAMFIKDKAMKLDIMAWIDPTKRFLIKAAKCIYVYGFLGVVLPITFAMLLHFYIILPLHTWVVSASASTATSEGQNIETTTGQSTSSTLAEHSIHLFQEYALGFLYLRIASRLIITAPASRAAEAFRRVTAQGYLNPSTALATRFFILPITLLATFLLLFPPATISLGLAAVKTFLPKMAPDIELQTKLYRYSYPLALSCVVLVLGARELIRATSRWRARIRDEVYLVGERLHNFGEKKPPQGSKSVVRKER